MAYSSQLTGSFLLWCTFVHTLSQVAFQWDPRKAHENLAKHGVAVADVVGVFEDPQGLTRDDAHPDESRFLTLF